MTHAIAVRAVAVLLLAVSFIAPAFAKETSIREGVIEQITKVEIGTHHHHGLAAIIGAGVGYGMGGLVGKGHGRDIARVAGELIGAHEAEKEAEKGDADVPGEQFMVRLPNGVLVAITQAGTSNLRVGQEVLIEGAGDKARVVAR